MNIEGMVEKAEELQVLIAEAADKDDAHRKFRHVELLINTVRTMLAQIALDTSE